MPWLTPLVKPSPSMPVSFLSEVYCPWYQWLPYFVNRNTGRDHDPLRERLGVRSVGRLVPLEVWDSRCEELMRDFRKDTSEGHYRRFSEAKEKSAIPSVRHEGGVVPKFGTRYLVEGEASRGSSFPTRCTMRITLPGRIISL